MEMPDMLLIIDKDTGSIHKLTSQGIIQGLDQVVKELARNKGIVVEGAFEVDSARPVRMVVKENYTILATRLESFPMETCFSILEGRMVPEFKMDARNTFLNRKMEWIAPANMKVWFVLKCLKLSTTLWKVELPFLFATDTQPGSWKLPLPNIYPGDGKLCLGDGVHNLVHATLSGLMAMSLALFRGSNWNSDAMPNMNRSREMFRFDPQTGVTLAPARQWTELCEKFSNPVVLEAVP